MDTTTLAALAVLTAPLLVLAVRRRDGCVPGAVRPDRGRFRAVFAAAVLYLLALRFRDRGDRQLRRHAARARELREALERGGLTFIKLGQALSTRRDVLPAELVDELARLQEDCPHTPWADMRAVLATELGCPDDIFADIDQRPIASASIAQVYRGRLHSGADVVVKVQRPGLWPLLEADLRAVLLLARVLERATRWGRRLKLRQLAVGFAAAIREELDFRIEVRNMAEVRVPGEVVLPLVHEQWCTERVIVMERLLGRTLTGGPRREGVGEPEALALARKLFRCVLRQITVTGVFHADPHAGNIMLLTDGRIGLIDFGVVGRLDDRTRQAFRRLLLAMELRDEVDACAALLTLTVHTAPVDEKALRSATRELIDRFAGTGSLNEMELVGELYRLITRFRLAVPPTLAAVFRCLIVMQGTICQLAPRFDMIAESRRFAAAELCAQLRQWPRGPLIDELTALVPLLLSVPRRAGRLISRWENRSAAEPEPAAPERRPPVPVIALVALTVVLVTATVLTLGTGPQPLLRLAPELMHLLCYPVLVAAVILVAGAVRRRRGRPGPRRPVGKR